MTGAMTALWSSPERHGGYLGGRHDGSRPSRGGRRPFEPPCGEGREPGACPDQAGGHVVTIGATESTLPVRQLVTAAA